MSLFKVMDEEKKFKIKGIIDSMRKEGASIEEIKSNLKVIGLAELEIDEIINSIDNTPNAKDLHDRVGKVHEIVASGKHIEPALEEVKKFSEQTTDMKVKVDEIHGEFTDQGEKLSDLKENYDDHRKNLDKISEKVDKLTEKHDAIHENLGETAFLRNEVREIKELLLEMKPLISGVAELQEKMIQVNKDLLIRMKK